MYNVEITFIIWPGRTEFNIILEYFFCIKGFRLLSGSVWDRAGFGILVVLLSLGLYQVLAKQRQLLMNPLIMPCTQLPVVQTAVVYQNVTVGKAAAAVPTSC